jgi:pimeloyl-ACP methyl ester carboxylesterase
MEPLQRQFVNTSKREVCADDALILHVHEFGRSGDPGVLMLHGLGQTGQSWHGAARQLAESGFHVLCPDFRGHGASDWAPGGEYSLLDFLADVRRHARLFAKPPIIVGASMGGLLALLGEAEANQTLARALVLVDITPRWERKGVERILSFMRAAPNGFGSLEEAQGAIAEHLPHRAGESSDRRLRRMLDQHHDGRWYWHWDPALLDQIEQQSEQYPQRLLAAARVLTAPVLLVSGSRSDVVSRETITEFLNAVPHAQHADIAEATHMVAGDNNDAFNQALLNFIGGLASESVQRAAAATVSA